MTDQSVLSSVIITKSGFAQINEFKESHAKFHF